MGIFVIFWLFLFLLPAEAANYFTPITGDTHYKLVFDDEFNETNGLNQSLWSTSDRQCDQVYPGCYAEWLASNVSVHNGVLDLAVTPGPTIDGFQYGTAIVYSNKTSIPNEPIDIYMEAYIKPMDQAYGLASGFWTNQAPNFTYPEVDVLEYWQATSPLYSSFNYFPAAGGLHEQMYYFGFDLGYGWHVFSAWWNPVSVTFYVDGIRTWMVNIPGAYVTTPTFDAIFNTTMGCCTVLPNNTTLLPNHMYVKYVHVYSAQPGAVAINPQYGYGGLGYHW